MSSEIDDRLSDLPDSILHLILSFLNIKQAFQSSVLSTRWKNLPNHLPSLRLTAQHFKSMESFTKSVSQILSHRDNSTVLHTLEFTRPEDFVEFHIIKSVVKFAVTHHVKRLQICITSDIQLFRRCLFSSQTLTSLQLWVHEVIQDWKMLFPNSLNLPSLTDLSLAGFCFGPGAGNDGCADCAEPFSAFNKLNTLTILSCRVLKARNLSISSTSLVNLTMSGYYLNIDDQFQLHLCAPSLRNFAFTGTPNQKLCLSHPCSLQHLYIDSTDISANFTVEGSVTMVEEDSTLLLSWLQELPSIKSLTVSSNTLQVLSFVPDLFKVKFSSMCNLESLKVEMKPLTRELDMKLGIAASLKEDEDTKFNLRQGPFIPDGVVDFLLQNSPSTKVNIIPINARGF
ncbi:unnamed protein product [Lathyrus sativus]|nr:unnamed protein product [Lathyrus sativus]